MPPLYRKKRKPNSAVAPRDKNACVFCEQVEDDEQKYGKFLSKNETRAHNFCMLFASDLRQNGDNDEQGILGFLESDIKKELRRASRLTCRYCGDVGAAVGCAVKKCKRIFHLGCGLDNGGLFQFYGSFDAYCSDHRPRQQPLPELERGSPLPDCPICFCDVENEPSTETLRAPCCTRAWYHRQCIQQQARTAGLHFFRCPLCNEQECFQKEMLMYGIYIPDQDAAWETEPNAFQELLERYNNCDVARCLCPQGRNYDQPDKDWNLLVCCTCSSAGAHSRCVGLRTRNPDYEWTCKDCRKIVGVKYKKKSTDKKVSVKAERHPYKPQYKPIKRGVKRKRSSAWARGMVRSATKRLRIAHSPWRSARTVSLQGDTTTCGVSPRSSINCTQHCVLGRHRPRLPKLRLTRANAASMVEREGSGASCSSTSESGRSSRSTPTMGTPVMGTSSMGTPARSTPTRSTSASCTPTRSTPARSAPAMSTSARSPSVVGTPNRHHILEVDYSSLLLGTPERSSPTRSMSTRSTPARSPLVMSTPAGNPLVMSTPARSPSVSTRSTSARSPSVVGTPNRRHILEVDYSSLLVSDRQCDDVVISSDSAPESAPDSATDSAPECSDMSSPDSDVRRAAMQFCEFEIPSSSAKPHLNIERRPVQLRTPDKLIASSDASNNNNNNASTDKDGMSSNKKSWSISYKKQTNKEPRKYKTKRSKTEENSGCKSILNYFFPIDLNPPSTEVNERQAETEKIRPVMSVKPTQTKSISELIDDGVDDLGRRDTTLEHEVVCGNVADDVKSNANSEAPSEPLLRKLLSPRSPLSPKPSTSKDTSNIHHYNSLIPPMGTPETDSRSRDSLSANQKSADEFPLIMSDTDFSDDELISYDDLVTSLGEKPSQPITCLDTHPPRHLAEKTSQPIAFLDTPPPRPLAEKKSKPLIEVLSSDCNSDSTSTSSNDVTKLRSKPISTNLLEIVNIKHQGSTLAAELGNPPSVTRKTLSSSSDSSTNKGLFDLRNLQSQSSAEDGLFDLTMVPGFGNVQSANKIPSSSDQENSEPAPSTSTRRRKKLRLRRRKTELTRSNSVGGSSSSSTDSLPRSVNRPIGIVQPTRSTNQHR